MVQQFSPSYQRTRHFTRSIAEAIQLKKGTNATKCPFGSELSTQFRDRKASTGAFLTLHGASGTDDADLRQAITVGLNIIHINTEIRLAWRRGLDDSLARHPKEVVPYKILPAVVAAVKSVALARLEPFNPRTAIPPKSRQLKTSTD